MLFLVANADLVMLVASNQWNRLQFCQFCILTLFQELNIFTIECFIWELIYYYCTNFIHRFYFVFLCVVNLSQLICLVLLWCVSVVCSTLRSAVVVLNVLYKQKIQFDSDCLLLYEYIYIHIYLC